MSSTTRNPTSSQPTDSDGDIPNSQNCLGLIRGNFFFKNQKSSIMTTENSLEFVYHGTSVERWSTENSFSDLYVTTDRSRAIAYAEEWLQAEETPLTLEFSMSELFNLPIRFLPNAENVEQYKDGNCGPILKPASELTWEDTLQMSGTFAIAGFTSAHKSISRIIDLKK